MESHVLSYWFFPFPFLNNTNFQHLCVNILGNRVVILKSCFEITGAGSYNDPSNIPGLAHFLEHMVFMGSQKYPDENKFDKFMTDNGGDFNGVTRDNSNIT